MDDYPGALVPAPQSSDAPHPNIPPDEDDVNLLVQVAAIETTLEVQEGPRRITRTTRSRQITANGPSSSSSSSSQSSSTSAAWSPKVEDMRPVKKRKNLPIRDWEKKLQDEYRQFQCAADMNGGKKCGRLGLVKNDIWCPKLPIVVGVCNSKHGESKNFFRKQPRTATSRT